MVLSLFIVLGQTRKTFNHHIKSFFLSKNHKYGENVGECATGSGFCWQLLQNTRKSFTSVGAKKGAVRP
jgi:hypothetical protein